MASTPGMAAAYYKQSGTVALLLRSRKHDSLYSLTAEGWVTAILWASIFGCVDSLELLLDCNADVYKFISVSEKDIETPFQRAFLADKVPAMEVVLAKGADIDVRFRDRETALMMGATKGTTATFNMLYYHGASRSATSIESWTALQFAAYHDRIEMVNSFVLDDRSHGGGLRPEEDSAIHIAITNYDVSVSASDHDKIINLLLEDRAQVEAQDASGRTPLFLAAESGNGQVVKSSSRSRPTLTPAVL